MKMSNEYSTYIKTRLSFYQRTKTRFEKTEIMPTIRSNKAREFFFFSVGLTFGDYRSRQDGEERPEASQQDGGHRDKGVHRQPA
eukprot:g50059.t1